MTINMRSFDSAFACLTERVSPISSEWVPLATAAGRVLAEPVHARRSSPARPVAAMDGYAVCHASITSGVSLKVVGESRAGRAYAGTVGPGEAVRIFTGSPLPDGTDRCIMQEQAIRSDDRVSFAPTAGQKWHVRAAGSDFAVGDVLIDRGTWLGPRAMVTAAAADVGALQVYQRPRVAIIGTGDELLPPGTASPFPDAIPESVTFGIAAMVAAGGGAVVEQVIAKDDLPVLTTLAGRMVAAADVVVVTGGASVGDRDFAKPMFAAHGLDLLFAKVAIKPGKPVWLCRVGACWVLGLPGNPTSAMVTATLFLKPLLAALQGRDPLAAMHWRSMMLAGPLAATGDRESFVLAQWVAAGLAPSGAHDSGGQAALVDADWLIRRPAKAKAADAGEWVTALPF